MEAPETAADTLRDVVLLVQSRRFDEAERRLAGLRGLGEALDALSILGAIRFEQKRDAEAIALMGAVDLVRPDPRNGHNLALALERAGRAAEAIERWRTVIRDNPDHVPAHVALANALLRAGDRQGAADVLGLVMERASARLADRVLAEAMDGIDRIGLLPRGWARLANVLRIGGRQAEAQRLIGRRLAEAPADLGARLALAMTRLAVVHADEAEIDRRRAAYAADLDDLAARVEVASEADLAAGAGQVGMAKPFFLSYQGHDDTDLQRRYGTIAARFMQAAVPRPARLAGRPDGRIRVAFATSYFTIHSVSKLFRGWIAELDRERFEVIGYNLGNGDDATSRAIAATADLWRAGERSFAEWRDIIEADRPHALIQLEIGMNTLAVQLACLRLAPVQAMAWGHPITSGLSEMDYFLSSEAMEPPDGERHYTERLVRLPALSIHYTPYPAEGGALTRAALGLRDRATVYVCCQSLFKYLPRHDHLLPRIAAAVPDSQFLFIGDRAQPATIVFETRLRAAFSSAGLDADRHVAIVPPVPFTAFPSLLATGDVYLDSLGWSGGNTTLEAVTCGLPVVTHPLGLMRGRHSAGILATMGLQDRISMSLDAYVADAVRLADAGERAAYVEALPDGRARLFGDLRPVRALEDWLEAAVGTATG